MPHTSPAPYALAHPDTFAQRHIGPRAADVEAMLSTLGYDSLDALADAVVPDSIRLRRPLALEGLPRALSEPEALAHLRALGSQNTVVRSLIGLGYYGTHTPNPVLRNILENPGWYTQYTPYQAEIAQGRLEALVNFQTMVCELTGLPLANSSLLDEGTAAAEAMAMAWAIGRQRGRALLVDAACHPQTIAVLATRAEPLGLTVLVQPRAALDLDHEGAFGVVVQYPDTFGAVEEDLAGLAARAHERKLQVIVCADLLALTLLTPPGELGADVVVGSAQRFGVPMGAGGPHAAFLTTREEHKRVMPGRIIGLSVDAQGKPAYRLALQTREQHIRRDKATSNICTAQVLLAVMASMYAVYHGPEGLRAIARRVKRLTDGLAASLEAAGVPVSAGPRFDTLVAHVSDPAAAVARALDAGVNLRLLPTGVGVSVDETCDVEVLRAVLAALAGADADGVDLAARCAAESGEFAGALRRQSAFLTHPTFSLYHSEHELLRYMHRLQAKDLSLAHSMIPLGSCTMKLNATVEMIPVTWPEFAHIHPFAPAAQQRGYEALAARLESWLSEVTGFAGVSLQPNAGSQGEYAGLLVIRAHHKRRGEGHRDVCLIPTSAHGTNPASAVMAGMRVVGVRCGEDGDIDLADLEARVEEHRAQLAALMITYPSTHGVFEEGVARACALVHAAGGQVYMDGANMNAQVALCRPGDIGADVCHLNLHKTFCIPHGGGGPGVGPIGVASHLVDLLPSHPLRPVGGEARGGTHAIGPVSAAPYGSAAILPISYTYIALMGAEGLKAATQVAILNANYMAKRLSARYGVLYTGAHGLVAHEFILDCRAFKDEAGVGVDDIAKRLMDYGFHAPTMSWPVGGTLMVEPTESESKEELDRFCEAMEGIHAEILDVLEGRADREDNALRNAPHTAEVVCADEWAHKYTRQQAAYPLPWLRRRKFWPSVGRVDNAYGDRNLVCLCPPVESY
ncbi:MAG: aminomethyl-transferring glycine dehydrogenase [Deltaproteobacteria bacterium]|nr:aminomethyl-transferring glycine dehydrogenase [Deltaproteobacteria bacterium]